jgi:DNA-directed RNA polymerase beta subunit
MDVSGECDEFKDPCTESDEQSCEQGLDILLASYLNKDLNQFNNDAYDFLLENSIPAIILQYGSVTTLYPTDNGCLYRLWIESPKFYSDAQRPDECHQFGIYYTCVLRAVLCFSINGEIVKKQEFVLARLPLMTGRTVLSCPGDDFEYPYPGSFIMRGKSRTIPCSQNSIPNEPLLYVSKDAYVVEIRSVHADKIFRSTSTLEISIPKDIKSAEQLGWVGVKIPFQKSKVNVAVVAMALGCDLERFVTLVKCSAGTRYDPFMFQQYEMGMAVATENLLSKDDAVMVISNLSGKNILSTGTSIINNEVFPHARHTCPTQQLMQKAVLLAQLTCIIILYRHDLLQSIHATEENRFPFRVKHDMSCHDILTASDHMGSLFRLLFIEHMKMCGKLLRRAVTSATLPDKLFLDLKQLKLIKIFGETRLTSRLWSAVASGKWSNHRKGVSISLNTNNLNAYQTQIRRISSGLHSDGSHKDSRSVKIDQWGYLCAAYTPDGDNTGLVSELGFTAIVTPPTTPLQQEYFNQKVLGILQTLGTLIPLSQYWENPFSLESSSLAEPRRKQPALLYDCMGHCVGAVLDVLDVVSTVRHLRRTQECSPFAGIAYDAAFSSVTLLHRGGMLTRPLVVVDAITTGLCQLGCTITCGDGTVDEFDAQLVAGLVEYVSIREACTLCRVAASVEDLMLKGDNTPWTHLELSQVAFLGCNAATVPFVTGQQGPRLAYFCNQKKQIISAEPKTNTGSISYTNLWNCHRPLVRSLVANIDRCRVEGQSTPMIIAILAAGANQEDSIVMNQGSIDRGAMMASQTRVYSSEIVQVNNTFNETFENPSFAAMKSTSSYDYLHPSGLPLQGSFVTGGAVVIGKTKLVNNSAGRQTNKDIRILDISTVCKNDESGVVSCSEMLHLPNGKKAVVHITTPRRCSIGDKFTTYFSQKTTLGDIWPEADCPFTGDGMRADLYVSPIGPAARRTMSTLLEALTGKVVAITGNMAHGLDTQRLGSRKHNRIIKVENLLKQAGFSPTGTEAFYNGCTGELMPCRMFIGVVDYGRMVHIAAKKVYARSTGPRDKQTRQPKDGRRFGGGLRLGHMEVNTLVAYGVAKLIDGRFRTLSDPFTVYICQTCCTPVDFANDSIGYFFCDICQSSDTVKRVRLSFTFLKLCLELNSTGVDVKFIIQ